jgi:hypothetical protein
MIYEFCNECGAQKERRKNIQGASKFKCPDCEPHWKEPVKIRKYRCRGCWSVDFCCAHHVSYSPEVVIPMCSDCHENLHSNKNFLPHLTPEMKRREAENKYGVGQIGLSDTDFQPVEIIEEPVVR